MTIQPSGLIVLKVWLTTKQSDSGTVYTVVISVKSALMFCGIFVVITSLTCTLCLKKLDLCSYIFKFQQIFFYPVLVFKVLRLSLKPG